MPPESRTIEQEGVLIDNMLLVDEGHFCESDVRELLASARYPARNPERNISDLRAQLAACTRGMELLQAAARQKSVRRPLALRRRGLRRRRRMAAGAC